MRRALFFGVAIMVAGILSAAESFGSIIRTNAGFNSNFLGRNDDGSTGFVGFGFNVNFFGVNSSGGYVNNNGNLTLDSPLSTFTPFNLSTTNRQILAPFFADVDTRNLGSDVVRYGQDTVNGRAAFGVNWVNVGYYPSAANRLNSFQLVIIDRSDVGAGDFDFEFNYDQIEWETGGASGGVDGLGGNSARVGWSNGNLASFELAGSAINGAFLDGGPNALISNRLNSQFDGRYVFQVRNGVVVDPIPEPGSLMVWGVAVGLTSLVSIRRRKS